MDASAVSTDKYRRRRPTSAGTLASAARRKTIAAANAAAAAAALNSQMPHGDAVIVAGTNLRGKKDAAHHRAPNNSNAIYGDNAGQLGLTVAAYFTDFYRYNEQQRQEKLREFVQKYQHLLPIEDRSAHTEGQALSLVWKLGYTD